MEWQVVKAEETSGKSIPFVSVGRGQLDFNAVACDLVNDDGNYKYAQILKGKVVIGVRFLNDYEDGAIKISRKIQKGKTIKGMTVRNKDIIEKLFGKDGVRDGTTRYKVELAGEDILKILG